MSPDGREDHAGSDPGADRRLPTLDERVRVTGAGEAAAVGTSALLDLAVEAGERLVEPGVPVRSQRRLVARRFRRHRLAVVSLLVLLTLGVLAFGVDVLSPYSANPVLTSEVRADARQQPTWSHPFGTDKLGRDQLTRVMHALQKSLLIGLGTALLSTLMGVVIGSLAGFYGGWLDGLLMRFTDLMLILPALAVLLVLATNPEPSFFGLFDLPPATEVSGMILVLTFLGWMPMARIVRGELLSLREREFAEAATVLGASGPRVIMRHLLPNALGPIVVFATLAVGIAILTESTLSFLGAGIQLPDVSLGNLIADAQDSVGTSLSYLILFPGLTLLLVVLCVNFIGDGLRDALDPRSRQR